MKVAITSDLYYPMINGVAVFAHNLALGLARRGHEVLVICPSFTGKAHRRTKDGVTVVYTKSVRLPLFPDQINKVPEAREVLGRKLPQLLYRKGIWWSPNPNSEVKKTLDDFQPDVIHNQTAEGIAIAATKYAEKNQVPLVATGHAYPDNITGQIIHKMKILKPTKRPLDAALRTFMSGFLKRADYATMPTQIAIDELLPDAGVEALSNGINLTDFKPGKPPRELYEKFHIPKDKPMVLYLGRVDAEKSVDVVIHAFQKVLAKVPEAILVVAGDGIEKQTLEELAEELQIQDSVFFLGKVVAPYQIWLYQAADLFVTASETETQGIVLIEALATGTPLVAVDAGAVRELCQNNKDGYLCKPQDVAGIACAVIKILQNPELHQRFSKQALTIAKQHDLERTLDRFEEIYQSVIDSKNQS